MPRDLPIGNGKLLVNLDRDCEVWGSYHPQLGRESHSDGRPSRLGVWYERSFSWVDPDCLTTRREELLRGSPLTWSHASVVLTVLDYLERMQELAAD